MSDLELFVRESNWIEGIKRDPTVEEVEAHARFLRLEAITVQDMIDLVHVVQPNAVIRSRPGLNVRVGNHFPPAGGAHIPGELVDILSEAAAGDPHHVHQRYETLHPFTDGNGRSGRALWLWMMGGKAPLGFLHHWYYQSLANRGFRGKADTVAA